MKYILLVLATVLTAAVCKIPETFSEPSGTGWECHTKTCSDITCEESNCLGLVEALRDLYSQEHAKYDKEMILSYLDLVEERCSRIEDCHTKCGPNDIAACIKPAFDHFICNWFTLSHSLKDQKGARFFTDDIARINAEIVNYDCGSLDAGGTCDILEDHACPKCIESEVTKISNHLEEERVREIVLNYGLDLSMFYSKCSRCKGHYDEEDCLADARDDLEYETEPFWTRLEELVGRASATALGAILSQAQLHCSIRFLKHGGD